MFHSFSRKIVLAVFLIAGLSLASFSPAQADIDSSYPAATDFSEAYDAKVAEFVKNTKNKPLLQTQSGGVVTYIAPNGGSKTTVPSSSGGKAVTVCKPPKPNGVASCFTQQAKGEKWVKSFYNENDFSFNGATGVAAGLQAPTYMFLSILLGEDANPTNVVTASSGDSLTLSGDITSNDGESLSFTLTVVSNSTMFKVDVTATDSTGGSMNENLIDYKVTKKQNIKFPSKKNIAK